MATNLEDILRDIKDVTLDFHKEANENSSEPVSDDYLAICERFYLMYIEKFERKFKIILSKERKSIPIIIKELKGKEKGFAHKFITDNLLSILDKCKNETTLSDEHIHKSLKPITDNEKRILIDAATKVYGIKFQNVHKVGISEDDFVYFLYYNNGKKYISIPGERIDWNCFLERNINSQDDTPFDIYKYLSSKVYKQDGYCKWASIIIHNHLHDIPGTYLVVGPTGCGKTYLWEVLREKYKNVYIIDASAITQNGFKGTNINQAIQNVKDPHSIVVFDEFDKLVAPTIASGGDNVSISIQSDLLKVLDEGFLSEKGEFISTKGMTFILCGSFERMVKEKDDYKKETHHNPSIGFGAELNIKESEGDKDLYEGISLENMMNFGMIKEIAGRIADSTRVQSLSVEDYEDFIKNDVSGAIGQVSTLYKKKIIITDEVASAIATATHDGNLGLRDAVNYIKKKANEYKWNHFKEMEESGQIILSDPDLTSYYKDATILEP